MMNVDWHRWVGQPLSEAFQLSVFVLVIMTLMEYVALKRPAVYRQRVEGRGGWRSVCMGALLGWIPGCVGGFAAVSFYTHGFWRFGAVLAASVTALGDDAFRMWGLMPGETFFISLGMTILGIGMGVLADRWPLVRQHTRSYGHFQAHVEDGAVSVEPDGGHCHHHGHARGHEEAVDALSGAASVQPDGRDTRWSRWIRLGLIALMLWYVVGLLADWPQPPAGDLHEYAHGHGHTHAHGGYLEWLFENGLFLVLALAAIWVLCRAKVHFIQTHLWGHVIKEHFLSIFLWTLGTIYVLLCWETWMPASADGNVFWIRPWFWMLLAIGIGWIPYSGPHFLFIKLYAAGSIPLSVLLLNALVQDGHTSLVLLSDSRRQFVWLKSIKSLVAILIGLCGLLWGF